MQHSSLAVFLKKQNKTNKKQNKTKQNKTKQNKIKQNKKQTNKQTKNMPGQFKVTDVTKKRRDPSRPEPDPESILTIVCFLIERKGDPRLPKPPCVKALSAMELQLGYSGPYR